MTSFLDAAPDPVTELICSARGCRGEAEWGLLWNNPKLHTASRRKVWLACGDHREHLEQYLGSRSFLRATVPVAELEVVVEPVVVEPVADPPVGGAGAR